MSFPKTSPLPVLQVTERQQCHSRLSIALWQLGSLISLPELEQLTDLITGCLSSGARTYHKLSHVLQVAKSLDAIEVLAGLFHDCIYMQTDDGINAVALPYLVPYVTADTTDASGTKDAANTRDAKRWVRVRTQAQQFGDRSFALVAQIFGVCPGQVLAGGSANEFLSALFAVKCLQPFLSWGHLAQVAGAIEMTVPFRPTSQWGSPPERLRGKLFQANESFDLGLSPRALERAVERAVGVANRDLIGFAHPQVEGFLTQTWSLLPEQHVALRVGRSCGLTEFRGALGAMERFMQMLQPEVIFQTYGTSPQPPLLCNWLTQAEQNLAIARLYFGSRLVTLAVVAALNETLTSSRRLQTLGDWLDLEAQVQPLAPRPLRWINAAEGQTIRLLEGRTGDESAQVLASPITAQWVQRCRLGSLVTLRPLAEDYFQGRLTATGFLKDCPQKALRDFSSVLGFKI